MNATNCHIMDVWFAKSCWIAAVTSAGNDADVPIASYVLPNVLPVVAATAVCMTVVALLSLVSSPVEGLMIVKVLVLLPM
jgi:hypothetical protein